MSFNMAGSKTCKPRTACSVSAKPVKLVLPSLKIQYMPWCQVKHNLLCSSMIRFRGSWCYKLPWLFAAHQGLGFQWGQGELDTHGEPDACLAVTSLLAKMLLFLGWAEFCQLLSSVKFSAFAEA